MQRYFQNAELKRNSVILLTLLTVFMLITLLLIQNHHQQLKADYIHTLGAIASQVVEVNPELEKVIIPLITKEVSVDQSQKGEALLQQYGLTTELENSLFPYLKRTIRYNNYSIVLIFIVMAGFFFILNYYQYAFFYTRIRGITYGARRIIEGDYDIALQEDQEGDFSKLANAFNSMRNIILGHINALQREKQFLVQLMSDISHQLKTPLSSLIVYNDIMLHKELIPEQRMSFLLKKQDQLERMKWLIYSILKLARLDAKAIEFAKEEDSLNETIYNVIDALESKASTSQIKIQFFEDDQVFFNHDRLWLEEALINIVKNGIEHTPSGGEILISLEENSLYRRIVIEDTGEGIPQEELPKIFQRFYKAQMSRKSDSLGIGLALAKSIIESHGGVIEVQSELNQGSKFIIIFLK